MTMVCSAGSAYAPLMEAEVGAGQRGADGDERFHAAIAVAGHSELLAGSWPRSPTWFVIRGWSHGATRLLIKAEPAIRTPPLPDRKR